MHAAEHQIYKRWIDKWLPQIVYGANATGPGRASERVASGVARSTNEVPLTKLPGMQVVSG